MKMIDGLLAELEQEAETTRRVLESILSQEQEHADELSDWLST